MPTLVTTDFETIPDVDLADYVTKYKPSADGSEDFRDRVKALEDYARERAHAGPEGKPPMLPLALNKIVIAGVHIADIRSDGVMGEWYDTKHLSSTADPEPQLLQNLVNWFAKIMPRFVTFNGRSFDMPLMALRAMRHGIPMPFWFRQENRWENYQNRYATDYHFDVMDFLSCFGAASRMSLRDLMAILRLPDKVYCGGDIVELMATGKMNEAREYCEFDCLNTFIAYVHAQHLRGAITTPARDASIASVLVFLKANRIQPYINRYLYEWCSLDESIRLQCPDLFMTAVPQ